MLMVQPKKVETAVVVPDGTYKARLSKVTSFENSYGPRVGFEFTLQGKGVDGVRVMRSTSPLLSPQGKLADVLRGLLGRDLSAAELENGLDIEALVGTECSVLVYAAKSKNGAVYSNVEKVLPFRGSLFDT